MIRNFVQLATVIVFLALPRMVFAQEFKVGDIEITQPYARAMLPGAKVGGGYLKVINSGSADRLVSATAERAASVQLHEMKMDGGIMVMRELKTGIAIPANAITALKPGGYHVMFMNVRQPFKEGETVKATLTFEKAGPVDVEFMVGPAAGGMPKMNHDDQTSLHGSHADHATMTGSDPVSSDPQQAIPVKLKAMFETAGKPLTVEPVVVKGDWAIAGWAQDGRGGRALLKKKDASWSIHLCSGDGLKQAQALRMMGLSENDAAAIAAKLAEAEKGMAPEKLALFASFEGTVMVEGDEANAGHQHGGHGK
ncbi:copper(I)-binding protein [Neorhizobium sp. 2083]|uniref:copper uptake system-associated protein n=1 Tax=Neorhizobium sp. 2083 TaxID=2817762 RepID=UPI00285DF57E|nr:copper uptake system-associated protein [Neorhizobium sp. 2083]MDR6820977.1 copper(I)-binding protein [Neorhizobium sp. 2083]